MKNSFKNKIILFYFTAPNFFRFAHFFPWEENMEEPRPFSSYVRRDDTTGERSSHAHTCPMRVSTQDLMFFDSHKRNRNIRILFLGEPNQCSMRRCCWSEVDNKEKLTNHDFLYLSVPIGL